MQKIIQKKGFVDAEAMNKLKRKMQHNDFEPPAKCKVGGGDREFMRRHSHAKRGRVKFLSPIKCALSPSEITIYDQAVKLKSSLKRPSTSSEDEDMDWMDLGEDMDGVEEVLVQSPQIMADDFIADMKKHYDQHKRAEMPEREQQMDSSNGYDATKLDNDIQQAEAKKTRIHGTPGRHLSPNQGFVSSYSPRQVNSPNLCFDGMFANMNSNFIHSAMVDETYMSVASHLEEVLIKKIENGEYVDFAKLIPKDKIVAEDETELKLVMKEGKTYNAPVKESFAITGFGRWEQAFQVFSDIYTRAHPTRAFELVQYNHVIHTASLTYIWSNVYAYDQDFRIHMGKHPGRSWAILLQQSWSMRLQEKLSFNDFNKQVMGRNKHTNKSPNGNSKESDGTDACRRYNRGKCNFGSSCRYDHKCSYCFEFGHTILNCRKLKADMSKPTATHNNHQHHHHGNGGGGDRREVVVDK